MLVLFELYLEDNIGIGRFNDIEPDTSIGHEVDGHESCMRVGKERVSPIPDNVDVRCRTGSTDQDIVCSFATAEDL